MSRAVSVAVALSLVLMSGCGMSVRKLDEESLAAATTSTRAFPEPPHRVALATFEAMRAELASAEFARDSEFAPARATRPDARSPKDGEPLPANFPAFWLEWTSEGKPVRALMMLKGAHFLGKAGDGRPVEVGVIAQPGETQVTVRFDKLGDRLSSQALLRAIADRLAHPTYPPGSLEEAAALRAFFGGVESREALPSLRKKATSSG